MCNTRLVGPKCLWSFSTLFLLPLILSPKNCNSVGHLIATIASLSYKHLTTELVASSLLDPEAASCSIQLLVCDLDFLFVKLLVSFVKFVLRNEFNIFIEIRIRISVDLRSIFVCTEVITDVFEDQFISST